MEIKRSGSQPSGLGSAGGLPEVHVLSDIRKWHAGLEGANCAKCKRRTRSYQSL
jgi:hypothetical protein